MIATTSNLFVYGWFRFFPTVSSPIHFFINVTTTSFHDKFLFYPQSYLQSKLYFYCTLYMLLFCVWWHLISYILSFFSEPPSWLILVDNILNSFFVFAFNVQFSISYISVDGTKHFINRTFKSTPKYVHLKFINFMNALRIFSVRHLISTPDSRSLI